MVSDHQVRKLEKMLANRKALRESALKAGIDEKTARKYRNTGERGVRMRKPRFTATQMISALNEVEGSKAVNWNSLRFGETSKLPGFSVRTPPESSPEVLVRPCSVVEHPDVNEDICSRLIVRDPHYRNNCP